MVLVKLLAGGIFTASILLLPAYGADLSLGQRQTAGTHTRHMIRIHHHRSRIVRDYDGTPVVFRPYRGVTVMGPDGLTTFRTQYAADPVVGAPAIYSNGQPVLPAYPRGWPRTETQRYRIMAGHP